MKQNDLTPGSAGEIFLYQDSDKSGSVHRFVVTLTMHICRPVLETALRDLMPRFPQMFVGVVKSGESLRFCPLSSGVQVFEENACADAGTLPNAGSDALGGYLFRVSSSHKTLFFDWHISLCDGKGMMEFIKAVVFRYIELSGYPVRNDGTVKTAEEPASPAGGMDPYEKLDEIPASRPVWYMDAKAFNVPAASPCSGSVHFHQVKIPLSKVKGQVREYLSQPESFLSPLFSHALYERYAGEIPRGEYIVSTIKENLRPHFPTASLRPYFSPVSLAYNRKVDEYPFGTILMSQKKLLDAQLKHDALAYSAKRMMRTVERSCGGDIPFGEKLERSGRSLDAAAETATFSICNVGSIAMPETLQQYLTEFYPVVPGGSYASSLSVVNFRGELVVTVSGYASDRPLVERFVDLLNSHDIPAFISDEFSFRQIEYVPTKIAEENG